MTNYEMMELIERLDRQVDAEKAKVQRRAKRECETRARKASIRDKREAKRWAMSQWEV